LLLAKDQAYVDVLRRQVDLLYRHRKVQGGKVLLPQMYGDPRGYKHNGKPEFYHFTGNLFLDRLTEIYLWSMDRRDLERIPSDKGWIAFLEGNDPDYPIRTLQDELDYVRERTERMREDSTTAETRLADYLLRITPATTDRLMELMWGGYLGEGRIWVLHSRLRYFDPERRRAGPPPDVGALVQKLAADSVTVTLVNLHPAEPRTVEVQAGAYGEHQFTGVSWSGHEMGLNVPYVTVRLLPGAGARLNLRMRRFVNPPILTHPWNRSPSGPRGGERVLPKGGSSR
jgi:hypothetical protein